MCNMLFIDMEPGVRGRSLCRQTTINVVLEWHTTPRLEVRAFIVNMYALPLDTMAAHPWILYIFNL